MKPEQKRYTPLFEDLLQVGFLNEITQSRADNTKNLGTEEITQGKSNRFTWDRTGKGDKYGVESLGSKLKHSKKNSKYTEPAKWGMSDTAKAKSNFDKTLSLTESDINSSFPEDADEAIIDSVEFQVIDDFYERRLPILASNKYLPHTMDKAIICTGEILIQQDGQNKPIELIFNNDQYSKGNRFCFVVDRPSATVITIKIVPSNWNADEIVKFANNDPSIKNKPEDQTHPLGVIIDKRTIILQLG